MINHSSNCQHTELENADDGRLKHKFLLDAGDKP
jgi:hypothetical protein